jgi:uncharacterized protein Yka (UPF0111/DUF47 family)
MSPGRWFLPETPDVLRILHRQAGVTVEGVDAFAAWASGDGSSAAVVRTLEPRAEGIKRELLSALRAAFVTPVEPEDVFALSRGIDRILDYARDLVNESEVMACGPDAGLADMAVLLRDAVREIDAAIEHLGSDADAAIAAADRALGTERSLERAYYQGMAALLAVEDMRVRIARRELYRRCARIGETVVDVAERVVYAVMKQS